MENKLKEVLKNVCFGYMWENEKEDSYIVTLKCETKMGYITPKAQSQKTEKFVAKVKKVLEENGYEIISIKGSHSCAKGVYCKYFDIYDGKEKVFDRDVADYSLVTMGKSKAQWIYEFDVKIEIKK